jgi:hypothetical protein
MGNGKDGTPGLVPGTCSRIIEHQAFIKAGVDLMAQMNLDGTWILHKCKLKDYQQRCKYPWFCCEPEDLLLP